MRIGISCNAPSLPGGSERYAIDLAHGLADAGVSPIFFAPRFKSLPLDERIEKRQVNVGWMPKAWRAAAFARRMRALKHRENVDVLIACNRIDSADIAMCGGTHRGFLKAMGKSPDRADLRKIRLEALEYERAAIVMAHSQLMRQELSALYGLTEDKIQVLYPPVDQQRFSIVDDAQRAALRRQYGFGGDEIVLLFPSSSHERKGLDLVQAAIKGLDLPVAVVVAGRPPSGAAADNRIRYLGYVRRIEDCYRAADFTILAPRYEPFGLVGVESVLCGTPVIFPSTVGCHDVLSDEARLTFEPGNVESLRAMIQRAAQSKTNSTRSSRIAAPEKAILYDPSVRAHVDAVLRMAQKIVGSKQGN